MLAEYAAASQRDEDEILASINAGFEQMREREHAVAEMLREDGE